MKCFMIFTGREKEAILPKALVESEMHLDDRVCMMPLCTMLKCTTARLFQADEILTAINDLVSRVGADVSEPLPLRFIYKLGCDGTGGMSQYNQNAADGSFVEDNKLFGCTMSPPGAAQRGCPSWCLSLCAS